MGITYLNLLKKLNDLAAPNGKAIKIAIGGNCNTDYLLPGIKLRLAEENLAAEINSLDFGSWVQGVQQQNIQADFWVIWLSSLGATQGGTSSYCYDYATILQSIQQLVAHKAKVILVLPEKLQISRDYFSPLYIEYLQAKAQLVQQLPNEVLLIDPENLHSAYGDANWYADRYWSMSKLPLHPNAVAGLSCDIGNLIAKCIKPAVKAVIVDLDNTLWGGIVGEDGVDNLLLDVNSEGRPYIQMQYFLKQLAQRGIPICVVSKNNLADAQAPFKEREEMLLKLEDFVYFIANWEAKSANISLLAHKLNLNIDSLCFIDDSIYERSEVKNALPKLIVPDLPNDPDARVSSLIGSGLFVIPSLSVEDLERAKYYKADVKREEFLETVVSVDQYLTGLEMQLEPIAINENNLQRVVSLINRTNQFNLTNRRHTTQDVADLLAQEGTFAYCYRLQDKFGDSGIIAVLIASKNNSSMHIDTFLMSCRVLNRKVEDAVFDHLIAWCKSNSITQICGEYVRSAKNVLVEDLYSKFGMTIIEQNPNGSKFASEKLHAIVHPISILKSVAGE